MANELMQGLLQSLLQTPEQQQQAEGVQNVNLLSQPNPLAATLAYMMPQRNAGMERGVRGLFGLPQQMAGPDALLNDPSLLQSSAGMLKAAQALRASNPAQAATLVVMAQQKKAEEQVAAQQQASIATNRGASLSYLSELYAGEEDGEVKTALGALAPLVSTGAIDADKLPGIVKDIYTSRGKESPEKGLASAVTKTFANGVVLQALPSGETVVRDATGQLVPADRRQAVLEEANRFERDQAGGVAGSRAAGTGAVALAREYYDKADGLSTSLGQIDEAVRLLDEGASTGRIASLLPSVRQSTIALENLQREMGLNVIQNTTFGALSNAEMNLALETALPTGLSPEELKAWLSRKREAQSKMLSYVRSAASYLYSGGSIAGWIEEQKKLEELAKETQPETPVQPEATRTLPSGNTVIIRRTQ